MAKAKSAKEKSGKTGRPRIKINFELIDTLAESFCTPDEIVKAVNAAGTKCSYTTVERRVKSSKSMTFGEYVEEKRTGVAKPKLRKAQLDAALKGNATLLIFLGKQYLGQSDAPQAEINTTDEQEFEEALTHAASFWGEEIKTKENAKEETTE